MQHVFCVFENSIYSSLLSNSLDDKLRLDGAPQRHAKTTDAWALFAVRDACVCAFLRAKLSPTYAETLETTTTLLKECRKKGHVNAFLFAMLGEPPGTKDKQHTLTHTRAPLDSSPPILKDSGAARGEGTRGTGSNDTVAPRNTLTVRSWNSTLTLQARKPPSYIPPPPIPSGGVSRSGDERVSSSSMWKQIGDGSWKKLAPTPGDGAHRRATQDLDTTSPFMPRTAGEEEERLRRRYVRSLQALLVQKHKY